MVLNQFVAILHPEQHGGQRQRTKSFEQDGTFYKSQVQDLPRPSHSVGLFWFCNNSYTPNTEKLNKRNYKKSLSNQILF